VDTGEDEYEERESSIGDTQHPLISINIANYLLVLTMFKHTSPIWIAVYNLTF
jgi:hypothetical protein